MKTYDWADIEVRIGGVPMTDFVAIDYAPRCRHGDLLAAREGGYYGKPRKADFWAAFGRAWVKP